MRVTAGLSAKALAAELAWSHHKISKVEHGQRLITADEIRAWVERCGGAKSAADDLVRMLAESRSVRLSWAEKLSGGQGPVQATYVELLATSTEIAFWTPAVIPGPLQVAPYASAILARSLAMFGSGVEDLDAAVAARLQGGQYLCDQAKHFTFIVGEPALRWRRCAAEGMLAQIDRLISVADLPNVYLGIVPLDIEIPMPIPAGFAIYDQLALVETLAAEHAYEGGRELAAYWAAVDELKTLAVTGEPARTLLATAAARLRLTS